MNDQRERRALLIAYLFPPLGGSGALRPLKLAKYLPCFGWNPTILTVKNPDFYYANDSELLIEVPPRVVIKRSLFLKSSWFYWILNPVRSPKLDKVIRRWFFHPDDQIGWIPFAYFLAMRIVQEQKVNVIYSTSGPLSCHIIAYLVKRRTGITWIAEFRDEWFEDPKRNFATEFHRRLHYKLEGMIVNNADKIITMAPSFSRLLSKHNSNACKFIAIPAGYDPDDFEKSEHMKIEGDGRRFTTAFVGLFYDTFRPTLFLRALQELIHEGKVDPREIKVQFVGANRRCDIGCEDPYEICEFTGFVPRKRALEYVSGADVLLLLLSKERGEGVIPSKIFEYMASGRPILALIPPDGDAASVIRKTKSGIVADFDDVGEIKRSYLELYRGWREDQVLLQTDWEEVARFDQKKLTRELASIFDEVLYRN